MKQTERVLRYMEEHSTITPLQAQNELGVMRLAARIWDLRHAGHNIVQRSVNGKNRYGEATSFAEYRLEDNDAQSHHIDGAADKRP